MIHLLVNKLPSNKNNDIEWKNMGDVLYNKYSQLCVKIPKYNVVNDIVKHEPIPVTEVPSEVPCDLLCDVVCEVPSEVPHVPVKQPICKIFKDKPKKDNKTIIKPLEIILSESLTFDNSSDNIKQKLIEFISKKEFSKVFGMTKSADIMSGIVNNRWNKSTALFISFLFNKSVNYNGSNVLYNSEKNNDVIMTTI
jgi:hypothetical protein